MATFINLPDNTSQAQATVQASKAKQTVADVLYPDDLGDYYFSLDFYEYRTAFGSTSSPVSANSTLDPLRQLFNADTTSVNNAIAKPSSFAKIKLPIPPNLKDSFKVNYENTNYGATIGALAAVDSYANQVKEKFNAENTIRNIDKDALVGVTGLARGAINYAAMNNAFFGANPEGLVDQLTGSAVNPNLTVLFRGPTLKTHQFQWTFTARTASESANIRKIKAIITRAMHPERLTSTTSAILRYPCECLIKFVGRIDDKSFFYPLRPTVVEDASWDYAPLGQVSMFQGTDQATSITMSLSFQETSYYTRDSFDDGTQYGADGFQTSSLTKGGFDAFGVKST